MIRTLVAASVLSAPRVDQSDWAHLDHFDHLTARNAQATCEEMKCA
jgi:hypothetical protein